MTARLYRRLLPLVLIPAVLGPATLDAQVSGPWSACKGDTLSTWNCAQYYSGTLTLTTELKGSDFHQTLSVVVTVTAGRVTCQLKGSEVGEFGGPGMLAVEHENTANAGEYRIDVWCPEAAGTRPDRADDPLIKVMTQRAADYATLEGKETNDHPDADPANGVTGSETITWRLRRS